MHVGEVHAREIYALKVHAHKMHACKVHAHEMSYVEFSISCLQQLRLTSPPAEIFTAMPIGADIPNLHFGCENDIFAYLWLLGIEH
jgi:hypothetical protein